jgi:pimeloyl-ACP methyl ester carboxylesterase
LTLEGTRWQYTHGAMNPESVPPESYTLDTALLERPGNKAIQLDLFLDYASNVKLYPRFQEYFRKCRPPLLAIWGRNDPFFIPAGAEAFRKDLPDAKVELLDTGHFAIETHATEIATAMKVFLKANDILTKARSRRLLRLWMARAIVLYRSPSRPGSGRWSL